MLPPYEGQSKFFFHPSFFLDIYLCSLSNFYPANSKYVLLKTMVIFPCFDQIVILHGQFVCSYRSKDSKRYISLRHFFQRRYKKRSKNAIQKSGWNKATLTSITYFAFFTIDSQIWGVLTMKCSGLVGDTMKNSFWSFMTFKLLKSVSNTIAS